MISSPRRRVLITGGTSGIGQETVFRLVKSGYDVTFTARDEKKAEETLKKVTEQNNNTSYSVSYMHLELSSFDSINHFLAEVKDMCFDIVILNAGIMFPTQPETEVGIETTFQVNYLSHFHLIHGLIQQKPPSHSMHVVTITSVLIKACRGFWSIPKSPSKWNKTFCAPPRKGKSGFKQYARSNKYRSSSRQCTYKRDGKYEAWIEEISENIQKNNHTTGDCSFKCVASGGEPVGQGAMVLPGEDINYSITDERSSWN